MKTAVCIHGLARGSSEPAAGAWGERFKTLLSKIEGCDVFIHSWDVDIKNDIIEIFNPKNCIIEQQNMFIEEIRHFGQYDIYSRSTSPKQGEIFKTLSFLYSRMKSIELKKEYEIKNSFKYDCVLTTRFDVGHQNGGRNKTNHLKFDKNLDMEFIYQAYWNQLNAGASDHWFYSNSENIDIVGDLYNKLYEYIKPGSEYDTQCKSGWPLSNNDSEFTNETHESVNVNNLRKLTTGSTLLINNHCIYKHHFIKNNLWLNKSKFLNKELW